MAEGWKGYADPNRVSELVLRKPCAFRTEPVWVTPLVEGEPVPGETTWTWRDRECEVLTTPFDYLGERWVCIRAFGCAYHVAVADLTPLPEKKRYRVDLSSEPWDWVTVEATDRDDLRARLAALADDAELVG